ncbi:hypothetical protein [Humidesulfovibrio idahonensis]
MTAYPRLTAAIKNCVPTPAFKRGLTRAMAGAALACALCALPGQAFAAITDDAVLKRMDSVLEENARLRDEAWKARKHGHEAAKQAEQALDASDDRVEKTRVEALAHVAGVSPAQVEGLRKEGRSWGQAAGDLGVHPGFLGVGKTPLYASMPKHAKAQGDAAPAKVKRGKKGKAKADAAVESKPAGKKAKVKKSAKPQAEPQKKRKKAKQ